MKNALIPPAPKDLALSNTVERENGRRNGYSIDSHVPSYSYIIVITAT